MGRLLLLTLLLASCAPPEARVARGGTPDHAGLACVACHSGELAHGRLATVPREGCAASDCHRDGGPARVRLATVVFEHRSHGGDTVVAMTCAGCHGHDDGTEPLTASTDACALCHAAELGGDNGGDCRTCHARPEHEGTTSQGLPVEHTGLPWLGGECVRCHYDVSDPALHVETSRCLACHADLDAVTREGVGRDLHPTHTGVSCTSCHAEGGHRILAMSSAVDLQCGDCHLQVHDVEVTPDFPAPPTCNGCHRGAHAAQQRLVLGILPEDSAARPSEKFLDGLTCRSCHLPDARAAAGGGAAVVGSSVSCTGCHRAEYATVLRWWNEGTRQRVGRVEGYVRVASAALSGAPADDPAAQLLGEAGELLATVRDGGGQHNLQLAHRALARALERTVGAYRAAGRSVPAPPDLGREPREGLCSYCHFRLDDPWQLGEMSGAFHREVMRKH